MNLNGQTVLPSLHTVDDPQQVKSYLESLSVEVVYVDVVPFQVQENVVKYLVVVYSKVA